MAASMIRTWNAFGLPHFIGAVEDELDDDDDELREDAEDGSEDDDPLGADPDPDPYFSRKETETTDRLLRFAELISSDVQRYFGRGPDTDACDIYAGQEDEPEKLGPLAELFQETHAKKQGLPMIQRRLPSSFWTEPHPEGIASGAVAPEVLGCCAETVRGNANSSSTPDFSDLLEHWASERDNPTDFSCDYQLP